MSFFSKILAGLGIGNAHADTTVASDPSAVNQSESTVTTPASPGSASASQVDVAQVLEAKAASHPGLNWRTSIVDLLKVLDIDSSLQNRKELATELGYTGSTEDSAAMNIWLHRAVMNKLAANGGNVPADLRD